MPFRKSKLSNYAPKRPESPSCYFKKPCDYKKYRGDETICHWKGRCNQQKEKAD